MKKSRIATLAALVGLSLLGGVVVTVQAQGDSPITISNGSLHLESAVAWSQFKTQGNTKSHPQGDRSVPKIELTVGTNTQTFDIGGQRCQVTVKYGSTSLSVGTGTNGKGLSVSTDFTSFRPGAEQHCGHQSRQADLSGPADGRGQDRDSLPVARHQPSPARTLT
jgi:hypothetical protein